MLSPRQDAPNRAWIVGMRWRGGARGCGEVLVASIAVAGCRSEPTQFGVPVLTDSTASTASTSGFGSSSTTSGTVDLPLDDADCRDDEHCGELRCIDGSCYGCDVHDECPAELLCWNSYCREQDEVPRCVTLDAPVCGDGEIEALEECDGGPGCTACVSGSSPEPWIVADGIHALEPTIDGARVVLDGDPHRLARYSNEGEVVWAVEMEHTSRRLAVDASGATYVVGTNDFAQGTSFAPWLAAWDEDGAPLWSIEGTSVGLHAGIDVDDVRIVVGGWAEQTNSPFPRGLVAQYGLDGALQWSEKLAAFEAANAVVLIGEHAAVLAQPIQLYSARTLLRLDADGTTLWSVDVSPPDAGNWAPNAVMHDGSGGTWIHGEHDAGPWAARHDADGREIDRLECFGGTTGPVTNLAVGPGGDVAIAVQVEGTAPARPWIALFDGVDVVAGSVLADAEASVFHLSWRTDGRLVVGIRRSDHDGTRVLLVDL
jgi:hypothetical protein